MRKMELEMEAKMREREDQREERMLGMLNNIMVQLVGRRGPVNFHTNQTLSPCLCNHHPVKCHPTCQCRLPLTILTLVHPHFLLLMKTDVF